MGSAVRLSSDYQLARRFDKLLSTILMFVLSHYKIAFQNKKRNKQNNFIWKFHLSFIFEAVHDNQQQFH
jgi:hypothetical protein